jgi:hypothetical protein
MADDILQRLAAARPAHLAPDTPVDDTVRTIELTAAMAAAPTSSETRSPMARLRRRLRPVWGLGLAAVATVAALVVTTTNLGPTHEPAQQSFSGRELLLAGANALDKQPQLEGDYWYQVEHRGYLTQVPGKNYVIDQRTVTRTWLAADADKRWTEHADLGARPATASDEAAWKADGSPHTFDLTDPATKAHVERENAKKSHHAPRPVPKDIVHYEGQGVIQRDAPGGGSEEMPSGDISVRELRGLSTNAHKLADQLLVMIDEDYDAPPKALHELVVDTARQIAFSMPSPPRLRAAAYRLLADEPGVRSLGTVEDHDGRTGYGIAMPSPYVADPGSLEVHYVFDRRTGMPLGSVTVAAAAFERWKAGDTINYTTIAMRWTDQAPPFDTDTHPVPPSADR